MSDRLECRTLDDAASHLTARRDAHSELADRVRHAEKQLDTLGSPWWKLVLFRLDGWPPWYVVADGGRNADGTVRPPGPAWRPWRRWYTS